MRAITTMQMFYQYCRFGVAFMHSVSIPRVVPLEYESWCRGTLRPFVFPPQCCRSDVSTREVTRSAALYLVRIVPTCDHTSAYYRNATVAYVLTHGYSVSPWTPERCDSLTIRRRCNLLPVDFDLFLSWMIKNLTIGISALMCSLKITYRSITYLISNYKRT